MAGAMAEEDRAKARAGRRKRVARGEGPGAMVRDDVAMASEEAGMAEAEALG